MLSMNIFLKNREIVSFLSLIIIVLSFSLWHKLPNENEEWDSSGDIAYDQVDNEEQVLATRKSLTSAVKNEVGSLSSQDYFDLPDVFSAHGVVLDPRRPVGHFVDLESKSLTDARAAMEAFDVLESCNLIPSNDDLTPEMIELLEIEEAQSICEEILSITDISRRELVQRAARLGNEEAVLLLPSFPPPFVDTHTQSASESFLKWQEETIVDLTLLADQGNIDAKIQLARLHAGGFPAFEDYQLAYLYVDEVLRAENISLMQERAATSLRSRLSGFGGE